MERTQRDLVPRHAADSVRAALQDTRVVLINGVRQAGKSTLARTLVAGNPAPRSGCWTSPKSGTLLEQVYLIHKIPAWSRNLTTRAVATPKVVMTDSGLASHLVGQDVARLLATDGALGPLLEGFVAMELVKQLTWSDAMVEIYHFRTRDQIEVDLVLENVAGDIIGIEVKSTVTVRSQDFRGLRYLAHRVGSSFLAGYVLHTGNQTLPFGPNLRSMPISAIWTAEP